VFEDRGGVWQHNPVRVSPPTDEQVAAQIMAGDPPAISQLKDPRSPHGRRSPMSISARW